MVSRSERQDNFCIEEYVNIHCNCGCEEQLTVKKYTDKDTGKSDYYIVLSSGKFYSEQRGLFATIKNRLKGAFMFLRGKQYRLFDINISESDLIDFRNNITDVINS